MSFTGSGNFWNKKNMYSTCPKCEKKGAYTPRVWLMGQKPRLSCKYCKGFVDKFVKEAN